MNAAFAEKEAFLVTGAPHASAYYPRDFAWFYPDVLDPETVINSQDAVRRVRLLEKSVRLMLEAVRADVVTPRSCTEPAATSASITSRCRRIRCSASSPGLNNS